MDGRSLPRRSKVLGLVSALAIALTGVVVPSAQAANPSSVSAVESATGIGGIGATAPVEAEAQSEPVEPTEPTAPVSGSVSITLNVNADVDSDLTGTVRLIPADWDADATGNETIVSTNFDATSAASPITVGDVPAGTYVIEVKGNKIKTAYSGGAASPDLASVMTVAAGQTTTADAIVLERLPMGTVEVPIKVPSWIDTDYVQIALVGTGTAGSFYSYIRDRATDRTVTFSNVPVGKYRVLVTGLEIKQIYGGTTTGTNVYESVTVLDKSIVSFTPTTLLAATESFTNLSPPHITGTPKVGQLLQAVGDEWSAYGVDYFKWYADGAELAGRTSSSLRLTSDLDGKSISVRITHRYPGYSSATANSAETPAVQPYISNRIAPSVTGIAQVGQPLYAGNGSWDSSVLYIWNQWLVNGEPVPGATSGTFRPTTEHVGKVVSVRVTVSDSRSGTYSASKVSAATTEVLPSNTNVELPTISGHAKLGATLTVNPGVWLIANPVFTYQWLADGQPVNEANGNTFIVGPSQVGTRITVAVTAAKTGYVGSSAASEPTAVIEPGQIENLGLPYVTGRLQVGETLTASRGTWSVDDLKASYAWFADGEVIPSAPGDTLTLTSKELGKAITVQVTVQKEKYDSANALSGPTQVVVPGRIKNLGAPAITGLPAAGQTLVVTPGAWSVAGPIEFTWFADGETIGTGPKLELSQALFGKMITVQESTSIPGYEIATASSQPTEEIKYGVIETSGVTAKIVGTARIGNKLEAIVTGWDENSYILTFQWFADGQAIPGAVERHLNLDATHIGKIVHAEITASTHGWLGSALTTEPTSKVLPTEIVNHDMPVIFGNLWVGALLEFENEYWSPSGLTFRYQWYADEVPIPGATGRSFRPTSSQLGSRVTVSITASKPGSQSLTVTSAPTRGSIAPQPSVENTVDPAVSGTARVGSTLTVKVGAWAQDNLTYTYKWYADGNAISGATSKTFTLTSAQLGKSIKAKVTAHKPDWASGSATTKSTAKVVAGTIKNTGKATISGTTRVGSTLTAEVGTWSTTGLKYSYKWYANGTTITGATSSTLKLSSSHRGKAITVKVTASKAGYTSASSTSAATAKIGYGIIGNSVKPTVTGSAKVGSKLTAKVGTWSPSSLTYTYQWLANGKTIKGATKSTYTIPAGSVGKKFSVTVKAAKSGYTSKSVTSAQTKATIRSTATASGKLSTTSIKRSSSAKIAVTVKAPGVSKPTGTVYVKVGTKTVKATLKSTHAGKITVTLKGSSLSVGSKQKVTVSFTPDSATGKNVYKSAAKSAGTLTVKK